MRSDSETEKAKKQKCVENQPASLKIQIAEDMKGHRLFSQIDKRAAAKTQRINNHSSTEEINRRAAAKKLRIFNSSFRMETILNHFTSVKLLRAEYNILDWAARRNAKWHLITKIATSDYQNCNPYAGGWSMQSQPKTEKLHLNACGSRRKDAK